MSHRYIPIDLTATTFGTITPAAGPATSIVVSTGPASSRIDLCTGLATPSDETVPVQGHRLEDAAALRFTRRERERGPTTELRTLDGASIATLAGSLFRVIVGDALLVGVMGVLGERHEAVFVERGTGAVLALPATRGTAVAVDGPYAIAVSSDRVHVARYRDGSWTSVTVALPEHSLAGAIRGEQAFVLDGRRLLILELGALPFAPKNELLGARYAAVASERRRLTSPATVIASYASMAIATHPELGRLTLERGPTSPTLVAGDPVSIDDIAEPLPGVKKVKAWSHWGAPSSALEGRRDGALEGEQCIELPAPAPVQVQSRADATRDLSEWTSRWPTEAPPSLLRLLEAVGEDELLRHGLSTLGLVAFDVRPFTGDWGADPCLLAFAECGNGDAYGLYLYPPALELGPPPVVRFFHEDNTLELVGRDVEDFLARLLRDAPSEIGSRVAARLGLEAQAPALVTPTLITSDLITMAWTPGAGTMAAARAHQDAGDLIAAERAYVALWLREQGPEEHAALMGIYDELGWPGPLEAMRIAEP